MKMKSSLWIIVPLFVCLMSCGTGETENATTESDNSTTETVTPTKSKSLLAGVGACTLLSEATLQKLLPSKAGYNKQEDNDDTGKRVQCRIGSKEGFGSLTWAINYNENGWTKNTERYAKITTFKKIDILGADGAVILDGQNRIEAWKGNYAITINPPVTQSSASDVDKIRAGGVKVAEELFSKL